MTRIGSLFSGAGGLDLAALNLFPGSSMTWHAEINPAASRVLAHHWPNVPNLGDLTRVGLTYSDEEWAAMNARAERDEDYELPRPDWSTMEPVDVLTGGFPCQDVSAAGLRRGLTHGTRSGLWSYMAEAIDVLRPRFVLIENVKGLLSASAIRGVESDRTDVGHGGGGPVLRALGAVLGDLADLGFDAEWACVRASAVGACHRRERVFILAYPADAQGGGDTHEPRRGDAGEQPIGTIVGAGDRDRGGDRSTGVRRGGSHASVVAPVTLLPTPRASDGAGGPNPLSRSERMDDVETRVIRMAGRWGRYTPAIERHEAVLGRPAPAPTELSRFGNPRLSPAFAQWMMMWPAGWVTDPVIGLSRNDQLRIIGNGVVPAQAVHAFRQLRSMAVAP